MKPQQRKTRQVMIEEHIAFPRDIVVARITCLSLLPPMHVVGLVAREAIPLELLAESVSSMTALTTKGAMCTLQRKLRVGSVVKACFRPPADAVAALAIGTISTAMLVVCPMAANTADGQILLIERSRVTGFTRRLLVEALQGILRVPVVVEDHVRPFGGLVTGLAFLPEAPPVNIVELMAARAFLGHPAVARTRVAQRAGDIPMIPHQGKFRGVVIEGSRLPHVHTMTILAILPEATLMRIIRPMAVYAATRSFTEGFVDLVAGAASSPSVSPFEYEVSRVVIEGLLDEAYHVRVATLVLGMALSTFSRSHRYRPTMKSRRTFEVCPYIFMTVQTEQLFSSGLEGSMALLAILLDICVAGDHLTRHDQALQLHRHSAR
jgi:hypothetical protein